MIKKNITIIQDSKIYTEWSLQTANIPSLLLFTATWCKPCKELKKKLLASTKECKLGIIDIDQEKTKDLCDTYQIKKLPTIFIMHKDNIQKVEGYNETYDKSILIDFI